MQSSVPVVFIKVILNKLKITVKVTLFPIPFKHFMFLKRMARNKDLKVKVFVFRDKWRGGQL